MQNNCQNKDNVRNSKQGYYLSVNGLRAYAAIGIVMMHMQANNSYEISGIVYDKIIPFFTEFVFLFMIISAFSMCCGYYEKIKNCEISISDFYEKRYLKIWPFFAVLVVFDLLVETSFGSLMEAFANLTLTFALLPNPDISVIGVGWTLGIIFLFYMLFPFFCFLLKNKKRAWFSFIISLFYNIACSKYFFDSNHVIAGFSARTNFAFCSMFFMAGGLIYLYRNEIVIAIKNLKWMNTVLVILMTSLVLVVKIEHISYLYMKFLILFSIWLVYAVGTTNFLLDNPITRFISSISMEIYLCHMMIFRIIQKLHLNYIWGTGWLSYITTTVFVLIGAVLFSISVKWIFTQIFRIVKKYN